MSKLEIEYKDYKIAFTEYSDAWSCEPLGINGEPTLTAVKKKIDKWYLSTRRLGGIAMLTYGWRSIEPVTAVTIADDTHVWCKKGDRREKIRVTELMFDTPENKRLIAEAAEIDKQSTALDEKAKEIRQKIRLATMKELRAQSGEQIDEETAS